jgi:protein PhnA
VDTASYRAQDAGNPMQRPQEETMAVKDSNGTVLSTGDSVVVIKDLKVKGSSIPLKRGTVIKNIRLVEDDDENIEGNSDKIKGLVLKACYLKKA